MKRIIRWAIRVIGLSVYCKHGLNKGWVCPTCERGPDSL